MYKNCVILLQNHEHINFLYKTETLRLHLTDVIWLSNNATVLQWTV